MKIAVIGAGGVGGYYGALLAAAGHEVHFVARGPHLAALRSQGLQIRSILGDLHVRPALATDQPSEIGIVDLALFCTKAFSTAAAAREYKPIVGSDRTKMSVQKDVEGDDQLGSILGPQHVVAGATWLSSFIQAPGVIQHVSDSRRIVLGELDGRDSTRVHAIHAAVNGAGISAEISSNIQAVLWQKLMLIAAVAGVGSLTRLPMVSYRGVPEARKLIMTMMQETAAVATARGVLLDPNAMEKALEYLDNARPEVKASMQLDIEAGRPSELEGLIGVIVRSGQDKGIATPVAAAIYALLLPLELMAQ
jgi:2-dehydropantoate 2-reductase